MAEQLQWAPPEPTTEQLMLAHRIDRHTRAEIHVAREAWSAILNNPDEGLIDIEGPCGITIAESGIITAEAPAVMQVAEGHKGYHKGYRVNPYKPRTNPEDWHGAETTHPEEAYELIVELARMQVRNVMEVAQPYHIDRYGKLLVAAWIGARNIDKPDLIDQMAMQDITLPLGIKNGLDGKPWLALEHVERVNQKRAELAGKLGIIAAPAFLMYRGGESAQTPETWEDAYLEAFMATEGRLAVDTGHGTEMAHHPSDTFKKSVEGQIIAQEHLNELAERGYAPAMRIAESSGIKGQTDPNMPLELSLEAGLDLYDIKMKRMDRLAVAA